MFALIVTALAGFVVLAGASLAGGSGLDFQNRQTATVYRTPRRA